jgi:hypothetical protein
MLLYPGPGFTRTSGGKRMLLEAILVALNRYMMPLADDPQLCSATSFNLPPPESKAGSEQEVIVL